MARQSRAEDLETKLAAQAAGCARARAVGGAQAEPTRKRGAPIRAGARGLGAAAGALGAQLAERERASAAARGGAARVELEDQPSARPRCGAGSTRRSLSSAGRAAAARADEAPTTRLLAAEIDAIRARKEALGSEAGRLDAALAAARPARRAGAHGRAGAHPPGRDD